MARLPGTVNMGLLPLDHNEASSILGAPRGQDISPEAAADRYQLFVKTTN
ncbi:hypothetical protein [Xanthobacter agilis]|uniref:Uncharacterized protein n=1 Tax=Xanthobacter agilis TaxID=47492 RepID=A0ABU0LGN9_XANAG|nr:hypothetical protein [Xanthobacter agilis]MDQ0506300.1 hypothetical protein [Xanthobacter agilis]